MKYVVLGAALLAGCGEFQDPAIVLDLRPLAMVADKTEQLIEFDPANPPDPSEVHFDDFTVNALVADPGEDRRLQWQMTLCAATVDQGDGRCSDGHPTTVIGSGVIEDPELASNIDTTIPSARFHPTGSTFVLLEDAIERDPFAGFSGIDLEVMLQVAPVDAPLTSGVTATKRVRFAAKIPADRKANENPYLDRIDWDTGGPIPNTEPMNYYRCSDLERFEQQGSPWLGMLMYADQILSMMPVEATGEQSPRETYVVPTFDGTSRMFTENLSYQWLATDGAYKPPFTGGPKDPFGNSPPLHTEWTPPTVDEITADHGAVDHIDVSIWVVQRDERLGAAWFEGCVRVLNRAAPPS
jgi:hypothetical protein